MQFRQIERLQLGRRLECRLSAEHEIVLLIATNLKLFLPMLSIALPRILLVLVHWRLVVAEEVIINVTIVPEKLPGLGSKMRQSGNGLLGTLSRLFEDAVVCHVLF